MTLAVHLEQAIGIEAPADLYAEAIVHAAKNLAVELDIELENYDLSLEAIVTSIDFTSFMGPG